MHIGKHIQEIMKQQGRSASWLAKNIPCERSNVYYIYERNTIDTELLERICKLLNHDFFKEFSDEIFLKKNN